MIPLIDLEKVYLGRGREYQEAILRVTSRGQFVRGPENIALAHEFAEFCGGGYVALCNSGSDALFLAIIAVLGRGDGESEIVVPTLTFAATAEAVVQAGYRPVFADVDSDTLLLNAATMESVLSARTRAVIPVHLYGQMCCMPIIMDSARRHGLAVIEDACQAHGASCTDNWSDPLQSRNGKGPGQWGDAAAFSFYPTKPVAGWGDGGAVFSRHNDVVQKVRMLADHGRESKYHHKVVGYNSRLDEINAAIIRVSLRYAEWDRVRRHKLALLYDRLLWKIEDALPVLQGRWSVEHAHHLYVIQVERRNEIIQLLKERGIQTGIHYPIPLHQQLAFYKYAPAIYGSLPVATEASRRVLSLPLHAYLDIDDVHTVVQELCQALIQIGDR